MRAEQPQRVRCRRQDRRCAAPPTRRSRTSAAAHEQAGTAAAQAVTEPLTADRDQLSEDRATSWCPSPTPTRP